jgi:MFS family permease
MPSGLLLIAAAGGSLFATGGGFWTLLAGRALIGVGAGAAVIAGFKAIVLCFPPERIALISRRSLTQLDALFVPLRGSRAVASV